MFSFHMWDLFHFSTFYSHLLPMAHAAISYHLPELKLQMTLSFKSFSPFCLLCHDRRAVCPIIRNRTSEAVGTTKLPYISPHTLHISIAFIHSRTKVFLHWQEICYYAFTFVFCIYLSYCERQKTVWKETIKCPYLRAYHKYS